MELDGRMTEESQNMGVTTSDSLPPECAPPAFEGFFMRTVLPPGAASDAISCNLLSPLFPQNHNGGKGEVVVLKETWLEIYSIGNGHRTRARDKHPALLCRQPVHGVARAAAALPWRGGDLDVLVLTSDSGKLSILYFDIQAFRLRPMRQISIGSPGLGVEDQGHFVAVHRKRSLVAVAALFSNVTIYLLDLESDANEVKSTNKVFLDELIVSICFLEEGALVVLTRNSDNKQFVHLLLLTAEGNPQRKLTANVKDLLGGDSVPSDDIATKIMPHPENTFRFYLFAENRSALLDVRSALHRWDLNLRLLPSASVPYRVGVAIAEWEEEQNITPISSVNLSDPANPLAKQLVTAATTLRVQKTAGEAIDKVTLVSLENGDMVLLGESVRRIGNFGRVVALAALSTNYVLICGDGCDGSIRKLQYLPEEQTYRLDLALEIMNTSPVSGFVCQQEERELIMCSGMEKTGSIRRVTVCMSLRVHSASQRDFVGCDRIWSVRKHVKDRLDSFVLVSFMEPATTIFKVDKSTGNLNDTGGEFSFVEDTSTLAVGLVGTNTVAQVHRRGVRFISFSSEQQGGCYVDWDKPPTTKITTALVKHDHVLLCVLERDSSPNVCLLQYAQQEVRSVAQINIGHEASCLDFDMKRKLLVVGTYEPSVQVWRLMEEWECKLAVPIPETILDIKLPSGEQAAVLDMLKKPRSRSTAPESVCLFGASNPEVVVSLRSGGLFAFDTNSSADDVILRPKFSNSGIGKLYPVKIGSERALLLLADRVWLVQRTASRLNCIPTSFSRAEAASSFSCSTLERGLLLVSEGRLYVVKPSRSNSTVSREISLKETPRRIAVLSRDNRRLLIVATFVAGSVISTYKTVFRAYDLETNKQVAHPISRPNEMLHSMIIWRGCIVAGFTAHIDVNMTGALRIYDLVASSDENETYELVFKETVGFVQTRGVYALAHHQVSDRLILGIGYTIYVCNMGNVDENGKRNFLRESFGYTRGGVASIHCYGNFVIVGERRDSILVFEMRDDGIHVASTDVKKRAIASCLALDQFLSVGTDKFGAFFSLMYLPYHSQYERSRLVAKHTTYVGETMLSLQQGRISFFDVNEERDVPEAPGYGLMRKSDGILAMTINGSLIVFLPLEKRDYEVLKQVEKLMSNNQHTLPLLGNDLEEYRSGFGEPTRNVVDGDLVSTFLDLRSTEQAEILSSDTNSAIAPEHTNMITRLVDLVTDLCI